MMLFSELRKQSGVTTWGPVCEASQLGASLLSYIVEATMEYWNGSEGESEGLSARWIICVLP